MSTLLVFSAVLKGLLSGCRHLQFIRSALRDQSPPVHPQTLHTSCLNACVYKCSSVSLFHPGVFIEILFSLHTLRKPHVTFFGCALQLTIVIIALVTKLRARKVPHVTARCSFQHTSPLKTEGLIIPPKARTDKDNGTGTISIISVFILLLLHFL